jgi:hypothetical protein
MTFRAKPLLTKEMLAQGLVSYGPVVEQVTERLCSE